MSNEPSNEPPEHATGLPGFLRRNQQQIIGFVGWFVISAAIWIPVYISYGYSINSDAWLLNGFLFPLTIIALIILGRIKSTQKLALGILFALAANLVLSLILGLFNNGFCFVPFYLAP